jgi:hypothetical protein
MGEANASVLARSFRRLLALLALAPPLAACQPEGRAQPKTPAGLGDAPETAAEIARDIVRGRTGCLFEVRRFRFHTSGSAIGRLALWGPSLEKLGLDPLFDVERAFVTSEHALSDAGIAVLEMTRSDGDVAQALATNGLIDKAAAFPSTYVSLETGETRVVALVRPGLVVVAPPWQKDRLDPLRTRARLPRVPGKAAARFFAFDPASSLGSMPLWPSSIRAAHAEIAFRGNGGARIAFFAESTSQSQAKHDASALTEEAHRLLAVNLGIFEMHLLDPPSFHAEGKRVVMETDLLPTDVDWILRFTGKP